MRVLAGLAVFLLAASAAAEPALRRVVLSSGGVGQFEFEADVSGADTLRLDVPLDQVDDVLKSLVVDDPAGPAQSVRLPGQQPLSESFRTLPFRPDAFASPEALLASLVGERVRVASTGARGAILSVSAFDQPGAPGQAGASRHRLTIATDDGIVSTVLEDTPDIAFESAALRAQVATALAAIAAQRVQDRRTLGITLAAGGARHVRFSYVVAVPVWKTSYRLTLPADPAKPARLQAFAVVENLSGRDWNGVAVTLTSGRPVLFHTPLYRPVFAIRPEAPVAEAGGLAPRVDAYAAVTFNAGMQANAAPAFGPPPEMPVQAPASGFGGGFRAVAARPPPPPSAVAQALAEVNFRLTAPVTAGSGQSLLLPIIDRAVPARRVALFQPATDPTHPLVALEITNDSDGALPPGLVTLFDTDEQGQTGYLGDARLPSVEPGEQRLASFALDLGVTVDVQHHATEHVTGGTISQGELTLQQRERSVTAYQVSVPKGTPRTIIIEQAKTPDDPLVAPTGKPVTTTPEAYRVTREVAAGTTQTIELVTEHTNSETHVLADFDRNNALIYTTNTDVAEPIRSAIQHAADLRAEADRRRAAVAALRKTLNDLVADQARIRQNLFSVPVNSALQHRYFATLQNQENELENLHAQILAGDKDVAQGDDALASYLANLKL